MAVRNGIVLRTTFPRWPFTTSRFIQKEDAVILATHGRALMIIDDISPLRQFTPGNGQTIHFFTTQPTVLNDPVRAATGLAVMATYTGENQAHWPRLCIG